MIEIVFIDIFVDVKNTSPHPIDFIYGGDFLDFSESGYHVKRSRQITARRMFNLQTHYPKKDSSVTFNKLKIASAVSLAILAMPAQAVVQIKDDVQLTDETYDEALQWTPGAAGNALELGNVTVDTAVNGHAGVLVKTVNDNDIAITDSNIKGGEEGYGLRFDSVTDGTILVENTDLSTNGGNAYTYKSDALSNSHLTLKDATLTGGARGISVTKAENGSVVTLDNTKINDVSSIGTWLSSLKDSTLNILNGSEINGNLYGLEVTQANGSDINIDKSTISGGNRGILTTLSGGASLNVTDSTIRGDGDKGISTTLNEHSVLNISGSTLSGKNNGLRAEVNESKVVIDNSTFTGTYGINFSGHDSDISLSNSEVSNLYLNGNNQSVDIVAGSDVGIFTLSGQGSSESNPLANNQVNIDSSKLQALDVFLGGVNAGSNTINIVGSEMTGATADSNGLEGAVIRIQDVRNNTINVKNSVLKGTIANTLSYDTTFEPNNNTLNLDNSYFEGKIIIGKAEGHPGLGFVTNMSNNTTWVAKGESNAETLNITDSTVDIQDAIVGADNWHSENTHVLINSESQLNIGTGSGDMNIVIKSDGKELETLGKDIINIENGSMDIQAEDVDLGAYKYKLVNKDGKWVLQRLDKWTALEEGIRPDGGNTLVLSNSANAVLSGLAAAQTSWNSQTSAVYERLNTRMAQDNGGVWGTYYGSEWAGKAGQGSTFNQKINGLAIGADKTLKLNGATATLGAAVMHDDNHLSDFDEKGSGGSMNSTALQAYGKLSLDNGLFFKGTASAGRTSSKLHVRSSDGTMATGDFRQTVLGLTGQAGYRYQVTEEVYVAPFVGINGYTASGENFSMSNGMDVKSDRYWSARGEAGVEAGVDTTVGGIAVTPHVMLSAGHEFVKNNDVGLNGLAFNNTVDGSGYKAGAGVEARVTNNLSAGVNVSYSNSQDVEQRFGITAGLRYSF